MPRKPKRLQKLQIAASLARQAKYKRLEEPVEGKFKI